MDRGIIMTTESKVIIYEKNEHKSVDFDISD